MEIKLSKSVLRAWKPGDEPSLVRHANSRTIWRNLRDAFPHPYTLVDAKRWIDVANPTTPVTNFAIVVDGAAVGAIVTEAVRAVTDYAFEKFDLCRVYAGVFEWNPASMRVLEKAGYELECRMKKSVTKDGETIDELIYAVVRA